jgi:hypothetical protein
MPESGVKAKTAVPWAAFGQSFLLPPGYGLFPGAKVKGKGLPVYFLHSHVIDDSGPVIHCALFSLLFNCTHGRALEKTLLEQYKKDHYRDKSDHDPRE